MSGKPCKVVGTGGPVDAPQALSVAPVKPNPWGWVSRHEARKWQRESNEIHEIYEALRSSVDRAERARIYGRP